MCVCTHHAHVCTGMWMHMYTNIHRCPNLCAQMYDMMHYLTQHMLTVCCVNIHHEGVPIATYAHSFCSGKFWSQGSLCLVWRIMIGGTMSVPQLCVCACIHILGVCVYMCIHTLCMCTHIHIYTHKCTKYTYIMCLYTNIHMCVHINIVHVYT